MLPAYVYSKCDKSILLFSNPTGKNLDFNLILSQNSDHVRLLLGTEHIDITCMAVYVI